MKPENLLITHNDLDGLGCQLILESFYGAENVQARPVDYPQIDALIADLNLEAFQRLYITDVFPRSKLTIQKLNEAARNGLKIFIFDHHVSSEALEAMVDVTHKDNIEHDGRGVRCSTYRTYQHFYPKGGGPEHLAETINTFDTGTDMTKDGGNFNKLYLNLGREWAYNYLKGKNRLELDAECRAELRTRKRRANSSVKRDRIHELWIGQRRVGVIRTLLYMDEYQQKFGDEYDMLVYIRRYKVSLRSGTSQGTGKWEEAHKIAGALFNGGGHPYAAGGVIPRVTDTLDYVMGKLKGYKQ